MLAFTASEFGPYLRETRLAVNVSSPFRLAESLILVIFRVVPDTQADVVKTRNLNPVLWRRGIMQGKLGLRTFRLLLLKSAALSMTAFSSIKDLLLHCWFSASKQEPP